GLAAASPVGAGGGAGDARPGAGEAAVWQVDTAAVLEIGQVEGDSAYQLYRVQGIAELPDGRIAVANAGTNQVRIYDAQGRYLRALGRSGEGPGEFAMLLDVRARGDTVYAYDRAIGRLTRFLAAGPYLDDHALRLNAAMMTPNFSGLLPGGGSAGWINQIPAERPDGFQRHTAVLLRIAGGEADTLGTFPGTEVILRTRAAPGGVTVMWGASLDYYRTFLAAAAEDRIYAGPPDSARIDVWDAAGTPLPPIRWADRPGPVDDALVAAAAERDVRNLEPQAARARWQLIEEYPRPAAAPVFDRLRIGPDGALWVRRYASPDSPASEWLGVGRDGALAARVRLPYAHEIRAVGGDRVYTVERDEYDVEYVRGYTLRR
ncbi:MAG: 6-bladed beta-propeller, partial [Gemmatimonadetes bacterium]|nr:6-bladed beta-propeller [Gemmatimonadota bacterium]